jgi:Z1 domain
MDSELRAGAGLAAAKSKALALVKNPDAVDKAAAEIARQFKIIEELDPAPISTESGSRWYTGPKLNDVHWTAYRERLRATNWSDAMLEVLDRTTTRVVGELEAPGNPKINTRGLVVGRVQSGKTANFTGVIAKAADCNYRFFIILSGTTKMLRLQTQKRIERDLTNNSTGQWTWLTRRDISGDFGDFSPGNANVALKNRSMRTIAVVKKNTAVLKRLTDWIGGGDEIARRDCPLLLIDDEADQASIPTGPTMTRDDLNAINRCIVDLLTVTPKMAYVGYTATPFANVLIDPGYEQNLYPRSFIYSLPTPDDYFGPERIFGRDPLNSIEGESVSEGLPLLNTVPPVEIPFLRPMSRADVASFKFEVTTELDKALCYFYMATAARLFRKERSGVDMDYSTALIHTSERVLAHKRAKEAIDAHRATSLAAVRKTPPKKWHQIWIDEMEKIDREKMGSRLSEVSFEDLLPYLYQAIDHCKIIVSNSNQNKETNITFEEKGQIAIVIGGNTLARGLTLEGLVVSFFVRTAGAYDTILQMGRWFGYRPFYEDLPRVWMTAEMQDDFYDLATVEEEFRIDLERYALGKTPLEVAARIRKHSKMRITAPNKMRWAIEAQTSYGGERPQTIYFKRKDKDWLRGNLDAAKQLVASLVGSPAARTQIGGRVIWRGAPLNDVKEFLRSYSFHERSRDLDRDLILGYIEKQNELGALKAWNVVIMGRGDGNSDDVVDFGHGVVSYRVNRSRLDMGDSRTANIKALMSTADILADQKGAAISSTMTADEVFLKRSSTPDSAAGVLLIYPISPNSVPIRTRPGKIPRGPLEAVFDVIGVAMVFPPPKGTGSSHDYVSAKIYPVVNAEDPEGDENPESDSD